MGKTVRPIPEGYHSLTPCLVVKDGAAAIDFYKRAFGAEERARMPGPDGKTIMHAEIKIGDSVLMLSDEFPGMGSHAPPASGANSNGIHLYVADVDVVFKRAVDAGATVTMPLADQFWGDRYGKIRDPFGHSWSLATHVKDLSPEEMQAASAKAMKEMTNK
jgi:PhnB protein